MDIFNVLKKYNLSIISINEIKKGYSSTKWKITDNNCNIYVAKMIDLIHRKNFPFALNVQDELKDETAEIIRSKDGNLCVFDEKGIFYITKFLVSKQHIYSSREFGNYLGHLHVNLEKIKLNNNVQFIENKNNYRKIEKLKLKTNGLIKEILEFKAEIIKNIETEKIDFSSLKYQVIHGDYYEDNLVFTTNGIKIIDFDQCCCFYREYEMLRGFFISIFKTENSSTKNFNELKKYVEGYKNQIKKIDSYNAYMIYLYVQANSLAGISDKKIDVNFAKKRYEVLQFLYRYQKEIIDIIAES